MHYIRKRQIKLDNNGEKADQPLRETNRLKSAIDKFVQWHEHFGDLSYDRMDFWSSRLGIFAKRTFYKSKLLGAPFAMLGLVLENFMPTIQKLFAKPHREVIGDAHLAIGYLNLYEITNETSYLTKAENLLEKMRSYSSEGYSGLCWGYSFGWQTPNGFWQKGIPMITITPYAFWAFKRHYELMGKEESKQACLSIATFALEDLNEIEMPNGTYCASYSPTTKDIVINSNTYRAAVLLQAYQIFGDERFRDAAERNIAFVLSYQGEDGEWYYEAKPPKNNFIDNFHTCFIIRNLMYCYQVNQDLQLLSAIKKGYAYYRKELFNERNEPKHFSVAAQHEFLPIVYCEPVRDSQLRET